MLYYKTLKLQLCDALEKDCRKSRKSMLLAAAAVFILCMINASHSEEFFITLKGAFVLVGIFAFLLFVVSAMLKMQFKRCVHKAYLEHEDSL